jgi:hypothetical protein
MIVGLLLSLLLLLAATAADEAAGAGGGRCCKANAGCLDPEDCLDPEVQPFCASSKANCEGKCQHTWCAGGTNGSSSSNFTIDASVAVHNTSEKYISFTFDLSAWSEFAEYKNFATPAFVAAARSFAPCLLRIGGTAEDNTTYDMSGGEQQQQQQQQQRLSAGEGIPDRTMTKQQWDGINQFAKAAGWEIVFGLNALKGWKGPSGWAWDPSNARELIEYTVKQGYPVVGWELGNGACMTFSTPLPRRCRTAAAANELSSPSVCLLLHNAGHPRAQSQCSRTRTGRCKQGLAWQLASAACSHCFGRRIQESWAWVRHWHGSLRLAS